MLEAELANRPPARPHRQQRPRPGDVVVTSGTGGIYAPGIPVAYVVRLEDDGAIARPLADPATAPFGIVEPIFEPGAANADAVPGT